MTRIKADFQKAQKAVAIANKKLYLERQEKTIKHKKQAEIIQEKIKALNKEASKVNLISDDDFKLLSSRLESCNEAVALIQDKPIYQNFVPHFREKFCMITFDDCSESQMCDLVRVYQSLDVYRTLKMVEDNVDDQDATFYKVLYQIEKMIRESDDNLGSRWSRTALDRLWGQMY